MAFLVANRGEHIVSKEPAAVFPHKPGTTLTAPRLHRFPSPIRQDATFLILNRKQNGHVRAEYFRLVKKEKPRSSPIPTVNSAVFIQ